MLFGIGSFFERNAQSTKPLYYPEEYKQDPTKSIIGLDNKYDLTRFSQHEAEIVRRVLLVTKDKYPPEYQSLGLVNESYVITYKPRYVLFEIAVIKYRDSSNAYDKFAAAFAFANKGAEYRLAALEEFEESIGNVSISVLDKFSSFSFESTCVLFSKLYEQEWKFDNAVYWLKMASRRGTLNAGFLNERIKEVQTRKENADQTGKKKRNRKISLENEQFERDVHNAAKMFLQE